MPELVCKEIRHQIDTLADTSTLLCRMGYMNTDHVGLCSYMDHSAALCKCLVVFVAVDLRQDGVDAGIPHTSYPVAWAFAVVVASHPVRRSDLTDYYQARIWQTQIQGAWRTKEPNQREVSAT